jgi:allophanate hydrolase subunit 2
MLIEDIDLTVMPISEQTSISKPKQKVVQNDWEQDNYKKEQLRLWEEKMIKFFESNCQHSLYLPKPFRLPHGFRKSSITFMIICK